MQTVIGWYGLVLVGIPSIQKQKYSDAVTTSDFKVCTTAALEESTIYIDSIGRVGTSLKKHLRDANGTRRRIVHLECLGVGGLTTDDGIKGDSIL